MNDGEDGLFDIKQSDSDQEPAVNQEADILKRVKSEAMQMDQSKQVTVTLDDAVELQKSVSMVVQDQKTV